MPGDCTTVVYVTTPANRLPTIHAKAGCAASRGGDWFVEDLADVEPSNRSWCVACGPYGVIDWERRSVEGSCPDGQRSEHVEETDYTLPD